MAASLPVGDPRGGKVFLGSVVDPEAAERLDGLIADAVDKGAELLCGGKRQGIIMQATVLDRVTPAMRIYSEDDSAQSSA